MAPPQFLKLPFKINIETESGKEFSYYTSSFAISTEADIDTSVILSRINGLESSSYSSDAIISETGRSGSIQTGVAGQLLINAHGQSYLQVYPPGDHPTGSGMPAENGRFTFVDTNALRQVLGYENIINVPSGGNPFWRFNNITGWRGSGGSTFQDPYNGWGGPDFSGSANVWLSASLDGTDDSTGFVTFHHTDGEGTPAINNTAHGTNDSADRLKRYRFYGTKVCNVLGFPAGQWQYPVNFQLDDTGTGINYFSGDVNANKLSVARNISFSPISNVTSNIRFDIDKSVDKFIQFTSGSAATQENNFLIGYDTDDDQYKIFQPDSYDSYISMVTGSFTKLTGNLGTGEISFGNNGLKIHGTPSQSYGSFGNTVYMRFALNLANNKMAPWVNPVMDDDGSEQHSPMSMAIGRNTYSNPPYVISGSVFVPGSPKFNTQYDLTDNAFHLYPTYYYGNDTFKVHMDLDVVGNINSPSVDGDIIFIKTPTNRSISIGKSSVATAGGDLYITAGDTETSGPDTAVNGGDVVITGGIGNLWGGYDYGGDIIINGGDGSTDGDVILVNTRGKVGIGLTDPGEKLSVAGNVMIGDSAWSDGTTTGDLAVQGKVGIGVTDPAQALEVAGTNPQILIAESATEFVRIGVEATTGDMCLGWDDSDDMHLGVFSTHTDASISSKMIIRSDGVVLIGRTTPAAYTKDPKLEIDGYISFDGFLSRAGTTGLNNGGNVMNFYWDGTYIDGWVDNVLVWPNETSDYRIKENVATMTGSFDNGILKKVNDLRPINYTQKSCSIWTESDDARVSFLAHEMADVFPNIVKGEYNATGSSGELIMQSYNNTHLTTYLVKAVQELTQAHNHLIAAITGSTDLNQLKASVTGSLIGI